jgi:hypothetical protein
MTSVAPSINGDCIEKSCVRIGLRKSSRYQIWQFRNELGGVEAEPATGIGWGNVSRCGDGETHRQALVKQHPAGTEATLRPRAKECTTGH